MKITTMKINGFVNPVGYALDKVLASWKVTETAAKKQTNAVIEVSKTADFAEVIAKVEGADLSSAETLIPMTLEPRTSYYWKVTVTADNGDTASETAYFETGKMDEAWSAKWIAAEADDKCHPLFQKSFKAAKAVSKARLYISAVGMFEPYLNGAKVGEDYLAPFLTDYIENVQAITYDITDVIKEDNDLGILVGPGWYMSVFGLGLKENNFGDQMRAIAEVILTYEDGTEEVIGTDSSWQYKGSDIEKSGIYFGEIFNRQLYLNKENPLKAAVEVEAPSKLVDRYGVSVKAKDEIKPVEIIHTPAGETVLDMGQNHAGYMQFKNTLPAGTTVLFEVGETLQQGNFYHKNYRDAESIFQYTSNGDDEIVRPHFTFYGYRYLKVTGWPGEITLDDVVSKVIYSDLDVTGEITTSNDKINRLIQNCMWGQKSNFVDIPSDCPQRSERLGWTGDTQVFSQTASYNMDTRPFYSKFFRDLRSEQNRNDGAVPNYFPSFGEKGGTSVWGDVGTFVPDVLYKTFGTLEQMKAYYPMMKDWVEWMKKQDDATGSQGLLHLPFQFGDWLALDGATESSYKGYTDDDFLGTCYYYQSTKITGEMAERLGYAEDAAEYLALADKIKAYIQHEYFTGSGRLALDTQASYIMALKFKVYTNKDMIIKQFKERLKKDKYKIRCGFAGAPLLCITLAENGMTDIAYNFLFQEGFPSWLYAVNLGATTIWERWNSILEDGTICPGEMNSLNHYSYGSVVEFMYSYIGGIRPAAPGFKKAIIAPEPNVKFHNFNCSYDSINGKFVSNWKIAEDGTFTLEVTVPFNTTAEIVLPRYNGQEVAANAEVSAEGKALVEAGTYTFTYFPSQDFRSVYTGETLLCDVEKDPEVMALLQKTIPQAFGIIMSHDPENSYLTFNEIQFLFFMGLNPGIVQPVIAQMEAMKRW